MEKKTTNAVAPYDVSLSRTQWLKGVLEVCLLSIIDENEAYGYEILQQLAAAGVGEIKSGTLYPRLVAMEKAGLVEVEWRVGESGPGRKYYRATPAGVSALHESRREYQKFVEVVQALIGSPSVGAENVTAEPALLASQVDGGSK